VLLLSGVCACAVPAPETTDAGEGAPAAERPGGGAAPVVLEFSERELRHMRRLTTLGETPLDATNRFDGDPRAEHLGRYLFFDAGLSRDGDVACATCHDPALGFSDGKPVAETLAKGTRRTPPLWNLAWGHWFFHDGRADSLWSQAVAPIENEIEMGGDRMAALRHVAGDPELRAAFEELRGPLPELDDRARFPERARPADGDAARPEVAAWRGMEPEDRAAVEGAFSDLGKLIAAYERRLVSRDSRFDRFAIALLGGDPAGRAALTLQEQRGLRLFLGKGRCLMCHHGPNFSDGEFHGLGLPERLGGMPTDPGRYEGVPKLLADPFNATGRHSDEREGERGLQLRGLVAGPANWGEFKTPSLRNVGERDFFMHAGQFDSLRGVLEFYSTLEGAAPLHQHQEQVLRPREFSEEEIDDLEAFLRSLQGRPLPAELLRAPDSPRPARGSKVHAP